MSDGVEGANRHETRTLEVKAAVHERFERQRKETKNAHMPAMEPSVFLSALLDTQQAAQEGYYSDE